MNGPTATLEDVIAAAVSRRASLVPETSGYLILGVAEAAQRVPLLLDLQSVLITADGDVELRPSGEVVSPTEAGRQLRGLLGQLLAVSSGTLPGLRTAANTARSGEIDALVLDIEAALIPMNRSAGRRAIARLARDTLRAGSRGAAKPPALQKAAAAAKTSPPVIAPAEPPPFRGALAEPPDAAPHAFPAPPKGKAASIPRPASPGERKLEALRGSLARAALRSPWGGWTGSSDRTPPALAPSPSPGTCSTSALTLPLLAISEPELIPSARAAFVEPSEVEPAGGAVDADAAPHESIPLWIERAGDIPEIIHALEPRGLTMRWSFAKDGSTGLLEGGAPALGRAEILAFFEQTPSAPIELAGSPTIAMSIEPFAAEPPNAGETLPWPASYPYERLSDGPAAIVEAASISASSAPESVEILELPEETSGAASHLTPSSAPPQTPGALPAGPDRADELLLRFAAGPDGETANIRAAAKGLRALAGVDLTPTAASLIPAATRPLSPEVASSSPDDITPPATSPGPASVRAPRPARRGLVRSALAFAAGLAGATVLMHVEPHFPERVAALLDQAIPAADSPSSPAPEEPAAPPADQAGQPASP